jgi:hypothetical protein
MTTYRLMDGANGRPGNGPTTATAFTGGFIAGTAFQVTASPIYLTGYWWWVCPSGGQATAPQKFALWQVPISNTQNATLIATATVTSGTLTAGQWNYVPLATPIPLTPGVPYRAATGLVNNFPDTNNQYGATQPYAAGITNGPLTAYSDASGSVPQPYTNTVQGSFTTGSSDPTVAFPGQGNGSFNSWIDVQVTDQVPAGATYRAWPNYPVGGPMSTDISGYTLGMQFSLADPCTLLKIWHWSPTGCVVLPTRCAIWDAVTETVVTGTDNQAPVWKDVSGATASPGDGWVYCDYTTANVTLQASHNYKVSTFHASVIGDYWFGVTVNYWSTGDGATGKNFGVLTVPNNANASPGQSSWNTPTWAYPNTSASPENDWIDVEVIPTVAPPTSALDTSRCGGSITSGRYGGSIS